MQFRHCVLVSFGSWQYFGSVGSKERGPTKANVRNVPSFNVMPFYYQNLPVPDGQLDDEGFEERTWTVGMVVKGILQNGLIDSDAMSTFEMGCYTVSMKI